ncbi:MAG: ANTAR domain-containing protein [Oscillospiraceae bacterium]|nr:ANTAR domain-containing protein [Oscillospiraceae bacterium]
MQTALLVTTSQSAADQFAVTLRQMDFSLISRAQSAGEARRTLAVSEFDLIVVSGPLPDEPGDKLAVSVSENLRGEVIFIVPESDFTQAAEKLARFGVITVAKPLSRSMFWTAVTMAEASRARFNMMRRENEKLQQKIEDIKLIDRAKCILIARMRMSEPEAHKYIEKQAMDMRTTRRDIANGIIRSMQS